MGCDDYPFCSDDTELDPPNVDDNFPYHPSYFRAVKADNDKGSAAAYTLDNYQDDASVTAIYPGAGTGSDTAITYVLLKLAAEAGEVGQAYAKFLRGDYDYHEFFKRAHKEIGDVLWYCGAAASELNDQLSDIALDNIRKLADRKQRGVIRGSGDDR